MKMDGRIDFQWRRYVFTHQLITRLADCGWHECYINHKLHKIAFGVYLYPIVYDYACVLSCVCQWMSVCTIETPWTLDNWASVKSGRTNENSFSSLFAKNSQQIHERSYVLIAKRKAFRSVYGHEWMATSRFVIYLVWPAKTVSKNSLAEERRRDRSTSQSDRW